MGKSWPHGAASNYQYLFVWVNLCIPFIVFFKPPFCNRAETELTCNTGITETITICILSYTDSWCLVPFTSNIPCDHTHKAVSLFWLHNHEQRHISVTQQGTQQENFSKKHAVIIRSPVRAMLGTVDDDLFWNWMNCIAWLNIPSEGNERPQLLSKKTNIRGFED